MERNKFTSIQHDAKAILFTMFTKFIYILSHFICYVIYNTLNEREAQQQKKMGINSHHFQFLVKLSQSQTDTLMFVTFGLFVKFFGYFIRY